MASITNLSDVISPVLLKKYVKFWINESTPSFDFSTMLLNNETINAKLEIKETGIVAGLPFVEEILKCFDCKVQWMCSEGSLVNKSSTIGIITGVAKKVLMVEQITLNIVTRASSLATYINSILTKIKQKWNGEIIETHKMTPGFKIVEEYAMYIGGMPIHKYDQSILTVIKESHIKANGSIENCLKKLKSLDSKFNKIEVVCENLNEALDAARFGADIVTLKNLNINDVRCISKQVKNTNPSILIKASGGINEGNIMDYAIDSVDIISSSLFSQGYKFIDISLNTITNVSSTPDIFESHKDINSQSKIENISPDKIEIATSVLSNTESNDKEKNGTKRKLEETKDVAVVDNVQPVVDTTKLAGPSDKIIGSMKQTNKQNNANNKGANKFDPTAGKQRKINSNGKFGHALYNLPQVGSARMPGQPVRNESKSAPSNIRANIDNQANFIRNMAASLVMSLQNNQPNNAPFMNPNSLRFGGHVPRVPFMNNAKSLLCKGCNFQNTNNSNPFCQMCRKKLE